MSTNWSIKAGFNLALLLYCIILTRGYSKTVLSERPSFIYRRIFSEFLRTAILDEPRFWIIDLYRIWMYVSTKGKIYWSIPPKLSNVDNWILAFESFSNRPNESASSTIFKLFVKRWEFALRRSKRASELSRRRRHSFTWLLRIRSLTESMKNWSTARCKPAC